MRNKRKTGLFLVTLGAMLGLMLAMAGAAYAEDAENVVEYQEASWDDTNKQVVYTTRSISTYKKITSERESYYLDPGWYVIDSDVTIEESIDITKTVNLILCDGCTLTVSEGISVSESTAHLNIYGQSAGTGELIATGYRGAGIGGILQYDSASNITIHGGTVTAMGGNGGAGIGSGKGGAGGNLTIYGGTVTATGGDGGAGIGGGNGSAGGNLTIYGGTVTATGGDGGAGIGGGKNGTGGEITIYGGTVMATGGVSGAGIGGSYDGAGGTVTIYGGLVIAEGRAGAAGIGRGAGSYDNGKFTVADGLIVYGDNDNPYPTTVIEKGPGGDYDRKIIMRVDYPHEFTYSASGATITATCSEEACSLPGKKAKLTITAPERTYYSDTDKSAEATLTGLHIFRSVTGLNVGDILYSGRGNTTYNSSDPPEDVGDYTAKVIVTGDADKSYTISVDYSIYLSEVPIDPDIPVVNTAKIKTKGNFKKKQMKIEFPASSKVDKYLIQYRMAGKKSWKNCWSTGKNTHIIKGLKKYSLSEFRIAGCVKQQDGTWVRGKWSKVSYRYMNSVPMKTAKAGKKSIKVTWKKDKKASGYQIRYSLKKNMAGDRAITVKGKSKTKYTIKRLKKGKKYYIKVRPIKKKSGKTYLGILNSGKTARPR